MSRLIINNRTDMPDENAIELILSVIKLGRISNDEKQYCYLTTFYDRSIHVATDLRKKSDSFTIYKAPVITPLSNDELNKKLN